MSVNRKVTVPAGRARGMGETVPHTIVRRSPTCVAGRGPSEPDTERQLRHRGPPTNRGHGGIVAGVERLTGLHDDGRELRVQRAVRSVAKHAAVGDTARAHPTPKTRADDHHHWHLLRPGNLTQRPHDHGSAQDCGSNGAIGAAAAG